MKTAEHPMEIAPQDQQKLRHHHLLFLAIYAGVMLLAFSLRVRSDQRVEFFFLPDTALPESCISRTVFDADCPGCGLTRSFIHFVAGNLSRSWAANRVGWLLLFAVIIQFPYRIITLRNLKRGSAPPLSRWHSSFSMFLIVALIGNWLLKTCGF